MITVYKQILPDSCLPSCLMMLLVHLGKINSPSFNLESKILIEGGRIGRLNRTFGHLLYVCRRFASRAVYVADKRWVCKEAEEMIKKEDFNRIEIKNQAINANLIEEMLTNVPVIVGVDNYVFNKDFHFPHFILVEKIKNKRFQIIEPWQGKRQSITKNTLNKAIGSLEDILFYWKELIQIYG